MKRVFFFLILFLISANLQSQKLIDRIIAVIGKEIILESELTSQVQFFLTQNPNFPAEKISELKENILEQMINDRLLQIQAEKDTTLKVTPKEIEDALNQHLENLKNQLGGEEAFLKQLSEENLTLKELRKRYKDQMKNQLLKEKLIQTKLAKITISTKEVKDFYETYRDSIPDQPEQLKLAHILLSIQTSPNTTDSIKAIAQKILEKAQAGEDFAVLAQKYSQDPTAKSGGDLGYFAKGDMVEEFEKAAYALPVGGISGLVQTQFGIHIIKVEDRKDEQIRARHILFLLKPSEKDIQRSKHVADSLHQELKKSADFAAVAKEWSIDEESRKQGGELGWFALNRMEADLKALIKDLSIGEISQPSTSPYGIHIFKVLDRKEAKKLTLENDWDTVKEMAKRFKTNNEVQKWMAQIKKDTYVEVKLSESSQASGEK